MARKRISEFRAKTLLSLALDLRYNGISISSDNPLPGIIQADPDKRYVVKVDQGIKGRFKKGLVALDQSISTIPDAVQQLTDKGFTRFIAEPMTVHDQSHERYLALEQTREGIQLTYSQHGGINIESHQDKLQTWLIDMPTLPIIAHQIGLPEQLLEKLVHTFTKNFFSFVEINPFVFHNGTMYILDAAVEVDSTATFFVNDAWTEEDFTDAGSKKKTPEEIAVNTLAAKSQAAFSLEVLNPNGSIFMMLSGGGASIVLADEVNNQGYGNQLANYGEYSGNPNAEETYLYARSVLSLLIKSSAPKKVLIIAGGVANFTDVRVTFNGLIKALHEMQKELQSNGIKVFVRRGGPYQEEGLQSMHDFLQKINLLGIVSGPDMVLTEIVTKAIQTL